MTRLEDRRREFRQFVWNHGEDKFQAKFDLRAELTDDQRAFLRGLLSRGRLVSESRMAAAVRDRVAADSTCLPLVLQLAGLTRNKILQDLKAHARNTGLGVSTSSAARLFATEDGRALASEYIARQLIRVFAPARGHVTNELLEVTNQATWPGYIRQERAKRMGHEAEYRIACLLRDCELPFAPEEKAENPLCRDVQYLGISYDIVSPHATRPLVVVKATVHTANIGQYGQSKDHLEVAAAVDSIRAARKRVTLLALVDGVGFESNRAGLNGVLENADEFAQFRTLWKVAAVVAHRAAKRKTVVALPADQFSVFRPFARRYAVKLIPRESLPEGSEGWHDAGDGLISIK